MNSTVYFMFNVQFLEIDTWLEMETKFIVCTLFVMGLQRIFPRWLFHSFIYFFLSQIVFTTRFVDLNNLYSDRLHDILFQFRMQILTTSIPIRFWKLKNVRIIKTNVIGIEKCVMKTIFQLN